MKTALLKRFFLLFCLSVLSSCSQDLIYSETAPSWVNAVRSGDSSMRVVSGDKILFRAIQKGSGSDKRENVCAAAIEKNVSYIKKAYPFSVQIPMTVELVFFDPKVNDCSTTISVSRQLMEKAESLSGLKGQYEKEMKRLKTETKKVQTDLKKANEEKQVLENKIKKLDKLVTQNQGYVKQIKTIEDFIEYAKNQRIQIKKKVENYIYAGMSSNEVDKIMKGHQWERGTRYDYYGEKMCLYNRYRRYKDYIICGIESDSGFVTAFCNVISGNCYRREFSY